MLQFSWRPKIKHRKFEYVPRFYEPEKEEFQERLKMLQEKYGETADLDAERMKHRIRYGLRNKTSWDSGTRTHAEKAASIKRLLIIFVLISIFLLVLWSDKLENLINIVTK